LTRPKSALFGLVAEAVDTNTVVRFLRSRPRVRGQKWRFLASSKIEPFGNEKLNRHRFSFSSTGEPCWVPEPVDKQNGDYNSRCCAITAKC